MILEQNAGHVLRCLKNDILVISKHMDTISNRNKHCCIPEAFYCVYALNKIGAVANLIHPRIWRAFAMKEIYGESVDVIKEELGVSAPRVYQFVAEAQAIGRQYRKDNP